MSGKKQHRELKPNHVFLNVGFILFKTNIPPCVALHFEFSPFRKSLQSSVCPWVEEENLCYASVSSDIPNTPWPRLTIPLDRCCSWIFHLVRQSTYKGSIVFGGVWGSRTHWALLGTPWCMMHTLQVLAFWLHEQTWSTTYSLWPYLKSLLHSHNFFPFPKSESSRYTGWTASCPTVALSAPAADSTDLLSQLREKIMETELLISKMFVAQVLVPETSSGKPHLPLTPVKKDR